jgi:hypothetical protein
VTSRRQCATIGASNPGSLSNPIKRRQILWQFAHIDRQRLVHNDST